ncbi:hypothetical protein [Levilactobacillus brevis]|uniref:hypothetical protein n=1 Tax=Levilactobacillus brevis TaxID=1580 RepID=UPI0021C61ED2|nr:hypothetical protein [Levilactobacillus brevis]MCU0199861.1 hypothetical protein [Levilactobacillus brevis]
MADSTPSQYTIMTNAALALIKQLVDAKNRIKSFRAVASDANHFTDDQEAIAEMTAVDSVKQDGVIQDIQDDGDTKSYIQIDFDQSKIDTAYQLQTVGLFATDEKGKEILYAVECLEHPQYMDVSTTMDMNSHFIHIIVGNTQQLDVSLTPAGTVSVAQLESKLTDYVKTDDVEKLIPATVIDGSKPADFKEAVTLEKGAVDGAGNAIATTKNLADGDATTLKAAKAYADTKISGKADDSAVVHTADMRKPANQVASIDEVNAKQDKLDYTPANAANVVHRNPDTGSVSEPVDFTKLTVNGGKSVATSDDLKSIEASAWRVLTPSMSSVNSDIKSETILYQVDTTNKCLNIMISMYVNDTYKSANYPSSIPCVPLESIITGISSMTLIAFSNNPIFSIGQAGTTNASSAKLYAPVTYSGTTLAFKSDGYGGWDGLKLIGTGHIVISSDNDADTAPYGKIYYTGLQDGIIQ